MSAAAKLSVEEADATLSDLLDRAERGEEVIISRHGRPIARIVPAPPAHDPEAARAAIDALRDLRVELAESGVRPFTVEEILALRHEGHKY